MCETTETARTSRPGTVTVDDELRRVEADVARHLGAARERAVAAGGAAAVALWDAVADAARGGKRLRPRLVLDVHAALRGSEDDAARQVATAFEMLHTAFCIHDDVIDADQLRHGRPTVARRYAEAARTAGAGPQTVRATGTGAGVLAGDLLLTLALRLVATAPLRADGPPPGDTVRTALLDLVDDVVQRTAAGELDDVLAPAGPSTVTLEDVVLTAAHKTAEYTFVGPVIAAALLARADAELVDVLRRAARALGIAYQLSDDLLGTFGDERETGKSARGDLAEGKVTALVVLARDTLAWPVLAAHLGDRSVTDEQADAVRVALEAHGVRRDAEELVGLYTATATGLLDEPVVPAAVRDTLHRHVRALAGRTR
ncbi:polyprenyl synthetase family protein [Luteimicrobium subarcticum]|uniref:Geranylgeranyl diphosphate synthase type II n=1 Tax=Luteimicrobium subarcticum TaxID=620910 RepID=A0A2M8WTA4_9MICO|nr:polyprenyl synthetase family protein [Luteimicrobium subarcticum]PJI94181.1 geranylgeranyl diphosphate synthase type II [Luteimicrobium subarcticum]